jgi:hypothetical protein
MGSGATKRALENSKTALQRIEILETLVQIYGEDRMKLLDSVNGVNAVVEHRLVTLEKCMNAVVEVTDKMAAALNKLNLSCVDVNPDTKEMTDVHFSFDDVTSTLKRQLRDEQTRDMENNKAQLAQAVADGALVLDEAINESSLIIGREFENDGSPRHPGWVQLLHGQAKGKLKAELIGKKAGDMVAMSRGTFEVLEVYKVVVKTAEELKAAENAAAPPAADAAPVDPEAAPEVNAEISEEDAEKALAEYMADAKANETPAN